MPLSSRGKDIALIFAGVVIVLVLVVHGAQTKLGSDLILKFFHLVGIDQAGSSPVRVVGGSVEFAADGGWKLVDSTCIDSGYPNRCAYYTPPILSVPSKVYVDDRAGHPINS